MFNSGSVAGPAIGSVLVGWLIGGFGWRTAFVVLGVFGVLMTIPWVIWYGKPETVSWLHASERNKILTERHGRGLAEVHTGARQSSIGFLLSSSTLWGLMLSQACIVYSIYLFLTWLPSYLQTTLHLDIVQTGTLTAIPYALTVFFGIGVGWLSDRVIPPAAVRTGGRRYFVVVLMLIGILMVAAPSITNTVELVLLIAIVLTAINTASAFNQTMANDLVENPSDVARVMSLTLFGGNICGLFAPIVTGYVISGTGGYDWAFRIAAFLLVIGAVISATMVSGRIGAQHKAEPSYSDDAAANFAANLPQGEMG